MGDPRENTRNVAVLQRADDTLLIRLDSATAKRESMAAIARGYVLAGYITATDDIPSAECVDGLASAFAMLRTGVALLEAAATGSGRAQ